MCYMVANANNILPWYCLMASLICIKVPIILFDDVYSVMFYFFKEEWIDMFVQSYNVNRTLQQVF